MLHCCIVSCILLVFIVLLMTTVNVQDSVRIKRQESSFDKIISEAEKVENSDQAMNSMSALFRALSNYYATLNVGPNDSTDLNSEANLNKHEVQKLLDTIQQVSKKIENEEHAVSAMDSLCNFANNWKLLMYSHEINFDFNMRRNHMDQILAVMNDLASRITDSKNAVLVMKTLTDNFTFIILNREQCKTLEEIMKRLEPSFDKIIAETETVETSDQAMDSMSALSEVLSKYYATLKSRPDASTDIDSGAILEELQVQDLLYTMKQVSEKIDNKEHAASAMLSLCNVANDWKRLMYSFKINFDFNMVRNHMDQILAVMNDLASRITDSKNAVLVMKTLPDNFNFCYLNQEQFETLVEIMKRLTKHWEECDETPSVIHCLFLSFGHSNSERLSSVLDIMLTMIKHINSEQAALVIAENSWLTMRKLHVVTPILKLFSELIEKVTKSEDASSVIYEFSNIIQSWSYKPDQHYLLLTMLQPLIDRIEDSEVESVKHALNTIRNTISQNGNENHKNIAREIQSIFDKRFPNLHC